MAEESDIQQFGPGENQESSVQDGDAYHQAADRRRPGRREDVSPTPIPLLRENGTPSLLTDEPHGDDDADESAIAEADVPKFSLRAGLILVAASAGLCTTIGVLLAIAVRLVRT